MIWNSASFEAYVHALRGSDENEHFWFRRQCARHDRLLLIPAAELTDRLFTAFGDDSDLADLLVSRGRPTRRRHKAESPKSVEDGDREIFGDRKQREGRAVMTVARDESDAGRAYRLHVSSGRPDAVDAHLARGGYKQPSDDFGNMVVVRARQAR